jgi:hypothetical protein
VWASPQEQIDGIGTNEAVANLHRIGCGPVIPNIRMI